MQFRPCPFRAEASGRKFPQSSGKCSFFRLRQKDGHGDLGAIVRVPEQPAALFQLQLHALKERIGAVEPQYAPRAKLGNARRRPARPSRPSCTRGKGRPHPEESRQSTASRRTAHPARPRVRARSESADRPCPAARRHRCSASGQNAGCRPSSCAARRIPAF